MASIKDYFEATFRGIAQIAFSDKIISGYAVFLAVLAISPMGALGCFLGVLISTFISFNYYKVNYFSEWKKGYFGYSSGVLGIILGSYLTHSLLYFIIFFSAVFFCSILDVFLKKKFIKYFLPTFALAAILTSWLLYLILSLNNYSFWISTGTHPLKTWSVYICIFIVLCLLSFKNKRATIISIISTLFAIFLSKVILNLSFYESSGLWAFNIATISYISSVTFLPLGAVGFLLIFSSVILSAIIWIIWIYSGFWQILPPIIAPFTISILILTFFSNKSLGPIFFSPNIWKVIRTIKNYNKICVLSGAGVSTPSGIPDYISGDWLDKRHNIEDYNFINFLKHRKSRKLYWDVCYKFYKTYKTTKHNIVHQTLFNLEKRKKILSIITQNVDGLHQSAGSKLVIELHGNISKVSCIHCKKKYQWNKIENQWHKKDIKCPDCLDFIKPSVIAMAQDLEPLTWTRAKNKIKDAKLLLILGTQLSITSALSLLDIARNKKIKIIIINDSPVAIPLKENEEILYFPLEKFFKTMSYTS